VKRTMNRRTWGATTSLLLLAVAAHTNDALSQIVVDGGAASREVQGGASFGSPPAAVPGGGVTAPAEPPVPGAPSPAMTLPAPIVEVQVEARAARDQVDAVGRAFRGKTAIQKGELDRLRGEIWRLYRARGLMAYVNAEVIPRTAAEGGSLLRVQVSEVLVHAFRVEGVGREAPQQRLLNVLGDTGARLFPIEAPLNLDVIDSFLKRRMFMEDVSLRVSLQPIDATHVDVILLVSRVLRRTFSGTSQYDNTGGRGLGSDRFTLGLSAFNAGLLGTKLDGTAMLTDGLRYGSVRYDLPIPPAGIRLSSYIAYTNYRTVISGPPPGTGDALEWGVELARPLIAGESLWMTGYLGVVQKHAEDSLAGIQTDDKLLRENRIRTAFEWAPARAHRVSGDFSLIEGDLDLSGNAGDLALDQAGPKTNGHWAKATAEARWQWNFAPRFDAIAAAKGQYSRKNLDTLELFTLGGANDLRGYGSGEARGDDGYLFNLEAGYTPVNVTRCAVFFDWGHIRRVNDPFAPDTVPNDYSLQDAGVSVNTNYRDLSFSALYAHQIGANPGLINGQDSDGLRQKYRAYFVVSYRF